MYKKLLLTILFFSLFSDCIAVLDIGFENYDYDVMVDCTDAIKNNHFEINGELQYQFFIQTGEKAAINEAIDRRQFFSENSCFLSRFCDNYAEVVREIKSKLNLLHTKNVTYRVYVFSFERGRSLGYRKDTERFRYVPVVLD